MVYLEFYISLLVASYRANLTISLNLEFKYGNSLISINFETNALLSYLVSLYNLLNYYLLFSIYFSLFSNAKYSF